MQPPSTVRVPNRRRYTCHDIEEGKHFLLTSEVPERLLLHPDAIVAFKTKWAGGQIEDDEDEHVLLGGKRVIAAEDADVVLSAAYADPKRQAGRDRLYTRLAQSCIGLSKRTILAFLKRQESYQLHQPTPRQPMVQQPLVTQTANGLQDVGH